MKIRLSDKGHGFSIGRLGAGMEGVHVDSNILRFKQIDMIERRILRIEAALTRAGIELRDEDLPE